MLGALFAVLSAVSFGFNNASARRGMISTTVLQGLSITLPIGVPLFFIACIIGGQVGDIFAFDTWPFVALVVAGVIHFTWGRYSTYRAVKAIGSNMASPVQQFSMLLALGAAMIFLGEQLTPVRLFGIVLVFVGPAIMMAGRDFKAKPPAKAKETAGNPDTAANPSPEAAARAQPAAKPVFEPRYAEGFFFAAMATIGPGISPVLVRYAIEQNGASLAAGFIGYLSGTVVLALVLIPKGRFVHVLSIDRRALPWFLNSGFFVFIAQMFRYLALAIAPVAVVTPIQRTSVVFRTIFAAILNRDYEVFDARVITGIAISFIGAIALSMSTDIVAHYLPLPAAWMQWRWP